MRRLSQKVLLGASLIFVNWLSKTFASFGVVVYKTFLSDDPFPIDEVSAYQRIQDIMANTLTGIPWAFQFFFDINVALKRISAFLSEKNIDREWIGIYNLGPENKTVMSQMSLNERHVKASMIQDSSIAVRLENGNFYWANNASKTEEKEEKSKEKSKGKKGAKSKQLKDALPNSEEKKMAFELRDLNINIVKGKLVFFIGKVASGKSSILYSLMGEVKPFNPYPVDDARHTSLYPPRLTRNGSIAFLSEKPWLMPTTIKENILVGKPFDDEKMKTCVKMA